MSEQTSKLAMTKTILASVGSVAATAMFARSIIRDYLPHECEDYVTSGIQTYFSRFSSEFTLIINRHDNFAYNEIYEAAEMYLTNIVVNSSTRRRLMISKAAQDKCFNVKLEKNEEVVDVFNGVKLRWIPMNNNNDESDETPRRGLFSFGGRNSGSTTRKEPCFHLIFHKKYKDMVMNSYLPFLLDQATLKKQSKKTLKLMTLNFEHMYDISRVWMDVTLDHPATFDTLAMDFEMKDMIVKDLDRFVERREYYRRVGKAWKRGYLLYGPPGTGKSSLIAAMANYLKFDIYDLDLTAVTTNLDLRKLLMATANRSILIAPSSLRNVPPVMILIKTPMILKYTRAGSAIVRFVAIVSRFSNDTDGLWSSCGDERIIIFTTNHKDKLDPALLRPGRMDVHIHMSYCTPSGFRTLATNYLGLKDHPLFDEIEELIETTEVTPAEVAEQMLHDDEAEATLKGLISFLHKKKEKEIEEANAKKEGKEVTVA